MNSVSDTHSHSPAFSRLLLSPLNALSRSSFLLRVKRKQRIRWFMGQLSRFFLTFLSLPSTASLPPLPPPVLHPSIFRHSFLDCSIYSSLSFQMTKTNVPLLLSFSIWHGSSCQSYRDHSMLNAAHVIEVLYIFLVALYAATGAIASAELLQRGG